MIDVYHTIFKVDVIYGQAAEFGNTHPRVKQNIHDLVIFAVSIVIVDKFEELPHLVPRDGFSCDAVVDYDCCQLEIKGILSYRVVIYRHLKSRTQDAAHGPDGTVPPSALLQLDEIDFGIRGADVGDLPTAEIRLFQDSLDEFVALRRACPDACLRTDIPFHQFRNGHVPAQRIEPALQVIADLPFQFPNEVFIDTPEDEQHSRYNVMIQDAMAEQNRKLHDGRCWHYNERGQRERCPYRKENPNFDPSRPYDPKTNPKTVRVRCEECPYERFKYAHDEALFSELEQENDCGETIPFEGTAVYDTYDFESYDGLSADVMTVLHRLKPKLDDVVDLLAKGLTQAEVARTLGKRPSTINSEMKTLRHLLDAVPELRELLLTN